MPERNSQCHLQDLPALVEKLKSYEILWQRIRKLRRSFKRRWQYMVKAISYNFDFRKKEDSNKIKYDKIQSGDIVRVKSKEEIPKTLDRWNRLQGCSFMEEMFLYCGTTQRVLKRVERFMDERDYLIKKCRGIVLLEGVVCQGTKDFGKCDRSCYFFWREEWLEKIGQ